MFKLSTRTRYGVRAMLDLAAHDGQGPVPMSEIAARQRFSRGYLEQVVARLRDAGLVRVRRGSRGGVMLAHPARDIRMNDIAKALDGAVSLVDCVTCADACESSGGCAARRLWCLLSDRIEGMLRELSLADVAGPPPGETATD